MTNEEKIEEIVIDAYEGWTKVGFTDHEMIAILSKLAEWKDQQFKEYLENKKAKLLLLQDNVSNQREFDLIDQRILLIDEIINKLFGDTNSDVHQKAVTITEDDYRKILDNIFDGNKEEFRKQFEEWLISAPVIKVTDGPGNKRFNDIVPNELYEKLVEKGMPELRETYAAVFDWLESKYIGIGIKHHWSGMVYQGYDWQVCQFDKSITPFFGTYYSTWQHTANAAIEQALELIK